MLEYFINKDGAPFAVEYREGEEDIPEDLMPPGRVYLLSKDGSLARVDEETSSYLTDVCENCSREEALEFLSRD